MTLVQTIGQESITSFQLHFAGGFINNPEYMEGDEEIEKKGPRGCRTPNVKLRLRSNSETIRDIAKYSVCYIVATRDVKVGKELYMGYNRQ